MASNRWSSYIPPSHGQNIQRAMNFDSSTTPDPPRRLSPPRSGPRSSSMGPARLHKPLPNPDHGRAVPGQYLHPADHPSMRDLQQQNAALDQQRLFDPLPPPPPIGGASHSRSSSIDRSRPTTPSSRPMTPNIHVPAGAPLTPTSPNSAGSDKKKHNWFGRKKNTQEDSAPFAWIAGHPQRLAFDGEALLQGIPSQDLWDNTEGNCYVYLFPRNSGKSPSFKIDSSIFSSSPVLTKLAFGDLYNSQAIANGDRKAITLNTRGRNISNNGYNSPPLSPSSRHAPRTETSFSSADSTSRISNVSDTSEAHLYLTLKLSPEAAFNGNGAQRSEMHTDDIQSLIDHRNFFAFLCGQALVATEKRSSFFSIFMKIASILNAYEFSNLDASTFGEVAGSSFDKYVDELALADVRTSREKTIEGIVLGERMKSVTLYNEAFTHAVGKLEDLMSYNSPKFGLISPATKTRLTRAAMDLDKRQAAVRLTLHDFDFTSLFTGIMISKTAEERKQGVRFDAWKEAFLNTRKWMISMLKQRYGDWPPKAKSKKNDLEISGLQRAVLRDLYHEMSSLYDLIADRKELTTRTVDGIDRAGPREAPQIRALRSVLSEYDRSSPPVKPPIPFDLPKLPTLTSTRKDFGIGDAHKDAKAATKKLKDDELWHVLRASWNEDAAVNPFVNAFRDMEKRAAHGCTLQEIVDLRIGQWLFMYAVIQALPMLVCDAPGLRYTQGVEYFLCEPPRSGVPWADPEKTTLNRMTWFAVGGAAGSVVSLPSDVIEHGVEGIYRRSHCWEMAEKWTAMNPLLNDVLHEQATSGAVPTQNQLSLPSFPGVLNAPGSRSSSPSRSKRNSSLGLGLEALPLPVGVTPDGIAAPIERPRSSHNVDASKTFDAILANVNTQKAGKRK